METRHLSNIIPYKLGSQSSDKDANENRRVGLVAEARKSVGVEDSKESPAGFSYLKGGGLKMKRQTEDTMEQVKGEMETTQ